MTSSQKIGNLIGFKKVPGPGRILEQKFKKPGTFGGSLGESPFVGDFKGDFGGPRIFEGGLGSFQNGFHHFSGAKFSPGMTKSNLGILGTHSIPEKLEHDLAHFSAPGKDPGHLHELAGGFGQPTIFPGKLEGFVGPEIGLGKFGNGFGAAGIQPEELKGGLVSFDGGGHGLGNLKNNLGSGFNHKNFNAGLGFKSPKFGPSKLKGSTKFLGAPELSSQKIKPLKGHGILNSGFGSVDIKPNVGNINQAFGDLGGVGFSSTNFGSIPEVGLNKLRPIESSINIKGGLEDIDLTGVDPGDIGTEIEELGAPAGIGFDGIGDVLGTLDLAGINPQTIAANEFASSGSFNLGGFDSEKINPFVAPISGGIGVEDPKLESIKNPGFELSIRDPFNSKPLGEKETLNKFNSADTFKAIGPPKIKEKLKNHGHKPFNLSPLLSITEDKEFNGHLGANGFHNKPIIPLAPHGHFPTNDFTYSTLKVIYKNDEYKLHKPFYEINNFNKLGSVRGHQHFHIGLPNYKFWK